MKQRYVQYDILKGIGILLVIICHAGLGGFPKEVIYTFHMPLFFFASGCFFKDMPFFDFLLKNTKQLLIPYLLFVLCMIAVRLVRSSDMASFLKETFLSINPLDESDLYLFDSIWFLVCLFNVRLLYWAINKVCKGGMLKKIGACGLLYLVGFVLPKAGVNIPLFIDTAFSAVIFFALGELFHKKGWDNHKIAWWTLPIIVVGCVGICYLFNPIVELKNNQFPVYMILLAIAMIVSFYYISLWLSSKYPKALTVRFLEKAGLSSLSILGFHNQIFYLIGPHLNFISTPHLGIIKLIILCIITVLIIFIIEKLINRFAPFLLGKF